MAWYDDRFRKRIKIEVTNTGDAQSECPIEVTVDTQTLISAGMMDADGAQVRFTATDEVTLIPFLLGAGINTANTKFDVRIDSIPVGVSHIYMYFNYIGYLLSASDSGYWYSSLGTEGEPELTKNADTIEVLLETGGSLSTGTAVERFSPTFNALNISELDFQISAGNTGNTSGHAELWVNITDGYEIFHREWASVSGEFPDPWDVHREYDPSGVCELNLLLWVYYFTLGCYHNTTSIITVILLNHASLSIGQAQEDCPNPAPSTTYYVKSDGDNALDGTSYATAWATLNHAFTAGTTEYAKIIRIAPGNQVFDNSSTPAQCTNCVGGYFDVTDETWHDWTDDCGHNKPIVTISNGAIQDHEITFDNISIVGMIQWSIATTTLFTNCAYDGMLWTDAATITFINTDRTLHIANGGAATVTAVHHILSLSTSTFYTIVPYSAKIVTDGDLAALIASWATSGDQNKSWTVEATGARAITFQLGDMLANRKYNLIVDEEKVSHAKSNASGVITFPEYSGSFSTRSFTAELAPPLLTHDEIRTAILTTLQADTDIAAEVETWLRYLINTGQITYPAVYIGEIRQPFDGECGSEVQHTSAANPMVITVGVLSNTHAEAVTELGELYEMIFDCFKDNPTVGLQNFDIHSIAAITTKPIPECGRSIIRAELTLHATWVRSND